MANFPCILPVNPWNIVPIFEMVSVLLDFYPAGGKVKDYHGHLPIHNLCNILFLLSEQNALGRSSDCISIFQRIVTAFPESLHCPAPAPGGELPLHMYILNFLP
jgi:hypothetical protein